MKIRDYADSDFDCVSALFCETVRTVNAKDYSPEQTAAWTGGSENLKTRRKDLSAQRTLIAEIDGKIVGFGSVDKSGCLDLLYVHKDYLRRGVATALCNELERGFSVLKTYASVTAKPFFENRGYKTIERREVVRSGVKLTNFEMQKKAAIT